MVFLKYSCVTEEVWWFLFGGHLVEPKKDERKLSKREVPFLVAILAKYTYTLLGFDENYVVAVQQSMIE